MKAMTLYNILLLAFMLLFHPLALAEKYPFSRLFTTPSERIYLDKLKNQDNTPEKKQSDTTNASTNTKTTAKNIEKETILRLSGFVKRADGQQQLWVNEKKLVNSDHLSGQLSSGKKAIINLKTKEKQTFIKVGQSWDTPKDEIIHVYKQR